MKGNVPPSSQWPTRMLRVVLLPALLGLLLLNSLVAFDWRGSSSMSTPARSLAFDVVYEESGRWFVLGGGVDAAADTPVPLERSPLLPAVQDAILSVPDPAPAVVLRVEFRTSDRRWRVASRGPQNAGEAAALSALAQTLPRAPHDRTATSRFDRSGTTGDLWSKLGQANEKIRMLREHLVLSKLPAGSTLTAPAAVAAAPPAMRGRSAAAITAATAAIAAATAIATSPRAIGSGSAPIAIKVLTYDRPESLQRLLDSLAVAHYGAEDGTVHLDIFIDFPSKKKSEAKRARCVAICEGFAWTHGLKTVHALTQNAGLINQWLDAWDPDDGRGNAGALILEDDLQVSPHYYTWLSLMLKTYGSIPELVGVSTQKQRLVNKGCGGCSDLEKRVVNGQNPFLYRLVGSWGYMPTATNWRKFRAWFKKMHPKRHGSNFDPLVPGLETSTWFAIFRGNGEVDPMWTQWFVRFCHENGLFTLYANLKSTTMGANWRESGMRHGEGKYDFPPELEWTPEIAQTPRTLVKYGWDARRVGEVSV